MKSTMKSEVMKPGGLWLTAVEQAVEELRSHRQASARTAVVP